MVLVLVVMKVMERVSSVERIRSPMLRSSLGNDEVMSNIEKAFLA